MLVLSLMSECDNNCIFCCVREERKKAQVIPLSDLKIQISSAPSDTIIDFFGGEPTLYPWFYEALSFARFQGHPCRIATNGRSFADYEFTRKIANLGVESVRTSLYGPSAQIHDLHTCRKGSFDQTIQGIRNLVDFDVDLIVNIVITEKNYISLEEMVSLLISLRVKRIKFGSLVNAENCLDLVPNNKLVQKYLIKALDLCQQMGIEYAVEKSALCLASKYGREFAYEPDPEIYLKSQKCFSCLRADNCVGIPKEQLELYGDEVCEPILDQNLNYIDSEILLGSTPQFVRWDELSRQAITIIIKLSSICNLNCSYCYARRNFTNQIMPIETVYHLIDELSLTNFGRIDLNFHGGEPLLYSKDELEKILQYSSRKLANRTLVHRIQSNGTLVNENWNVFFDKEILEIGISLDGPKEIHDTNRKFKNSSGSFDRTMKGIEIFGKAGKKLELLCVLTPASIGKAQEIMDFFIELRRKYPESIYSVNFSPSFEVDENGGILPATIPPEAFGNLMLQLFERWIHYEDEELSVPFFEQVITGLLGGEAIMCQFKRGCGQFLTVEPDGSVYPCDRFSGLDEFSLGNILSDSIETILTSQNRKKYINLTNEFSDQCKNCSWFYVCYGGCLYESIAGSQFKSHPSFYCSAILEIIQHIDRFLRANDENYQTLALYQ